MLPSELKLTSLGHCYIELPDIFVSKEPSIKTGSVVSIKSIQTDAELYVTWNGKLTSGRHAQLDLSFGQANNLQDELVVLSLVNNAQPADCSLCRVELVEASDYTILSLHLEVNLLESCQLVNVGLIIPIWLSKNVKVLVKVVDLKPEKEFCLLNKWTDMQFHHSIADVKQQIPETQVEDTPILNPIPLVAMSLGIDYKLRLCLGNMLVCGDRGSGKTHFLKNVIVDYKKFNSELYNCKQLRGKRPENIKKALGELLSKALDKQPSLLCLDDIDSITSCDPKHEDEKGQEAIYRRRLVDSFCYMLKQLERTNHTKGRNVMIVATCRSFESLDLRISKQEGRKYFTKIIKISKPNLKERIKIIENIIAEHKQIISALNEDQYETLAKRCSSFMPLDLRRFVERGIINACARFPLGFNSDPLEINMDDLLVALENYVPSNLRGVALHSKTSRTFEDVGGMKKVKETLLKTILLQIKYPKLFKKCAIKPQSSILLYGPPGCGKTMVAEALTNEDSINSICVRGPELLSKYIGASEAAVRDLFKRAELARPCVIFFDEFESIVSKRGSDSTGVTDRIVNQFLTLMDGVEKLSDDIFILAASSRPDMIDPAILRPGRLDKHIYCPLPDQDERLDILKVLSKEIEFEGEPNLVEWSRKLHGFTGADIQSLLYSAQLNALHDLIGPTNLIDGNKAKEKSSDLVIKVNQEQLTKSYDEMKPDVIARYRVFATQYTSKIRKTNEQVAMRATLA